MRIGQLPRSMGCPLESTGGAPPGKPYTCCPKFRLKLGDPLLLEDMLVNCPKLKVYVMHAGGFSAVRQRFWRWLAGKGD
jgi:predicted TIM-barrel fold metal-dependent hydrolase